MVESAKDVKEAIRIFFNLKFIENDSARPILEGIQFKSLNQENSLYLEVPFTNEEIKEAVWSCDGSKSPGPDGYNFVFIRKCWKFMKKNIINFVKDFHSKMILSKPITSSFLTLIPKIPPPY
ncbi:unnamed protein product [Lathyrus sativus]|nr:unnamed protein product [Lathyrus sativus]